MSEVAESLNAMKDAVMGKLEKSKNHLKRKFFSPVDVKVIVLEAYVETAFKLLDERNSNGKK